MSTIIDTLIYDRTSSDVARVFTLKTKILTEGLSSLTSDELSEYMAGMKGAYNYPDMNRVGQAVVYIATHMELLAITDVNVSPKIDWVVGDVPTQSQITTFLANLTELRGKLSLPSDAPAVPGNLDAMTYETANNIEKLLAVIDNRVDRAVQAFSYAGMYYCGE